MYQASATVTLEALASASPEFNVVSSYEMQSNIDVLNSGQTAELVRAKLGDIGPASASASYGGTANITITGTAQSAEDAARIANAYASAFGDIVKDADSSRNQTAITVIESRMNDLNAQIAAIQRKNPEPTQKTDEDIAALRTQVRTYEQQIVNLQDQAAFIAQGRVSILDSAVAPSGPYAPAPRRSAGFGALLGLLIGFGIIVIRQVLDRAIANAEDFDDASSGLPILGSVPLDAEWGSASDTHLVMLEAPATNQAESYRTLRTALQYVRVDDPIRLLQITSPDAQDGKTTTAANLAVALALTGRRVLLVDLDLRRPRLHEFFGKNNGAGFTSLVGNRDIWNDAITNVEEVNGLSLLPSGPIPDHPAELLESGGARELIEVLGHSFDIVIVD
ncbi:MAG: AAA family ATPase, partial [Actinomycetota bacterium]|nr:AAA family ATPase [Actinomycetota bacterium]